MLLATVVGQRFTVLTVVVDGLWAVFSVVDVPLGVVEVTRFSVVIVMEVVLVSGFTGLLSIVVAICVVNFVVIGGFLVFPGSFLVEVV